MLIERATSGRMPYAWVGAGRVVVTLPGLAPITGVAHDGLVRSTVAPLTGLPGSRRIVVLNRRERLPAGMTMAQLAAEHAETIERIADEPVDLVGTSTGGSIVQQMAADRPDLVRRLVIVGRRWSTWLRRSRRKRPSTWPPCPRCAPRP